MITLSPSALDRYNLCPGAWAAEKNQPWVEGPWADEGRLMHAVMANEAKADGLTSSQKLDIRICQEVGKDLMESTFGKTNDIPFVRERRRQCRLKETTLSGQIDFTAESGDTVLIIDWKFGREPAVPAEINMQLRAYAILAAKNRFTDDGETERVVVAIVQPRAEFDQRVSVCQYDFTDLSVAATDINAMAIDIQKPDAPRLPGPRQCKYCRAAGTPRCPESIAAATALVNLEPAPPAMPTGKDLGHLLRQAKVAESVIERLREYAKTTPEALEGSGWSLVPSPPVRALPDVAAAWDIAQHHLEPEDFMRLCKLSVGVLQETLAEKYNWRARDAKAAFNQIMGAAIVMEERAPQLKEVTDA